MWNLWHWSAKGWNVVQSFMTHAEAEAARSEAAAPPGTMIITEAGEQFDDFLASNRHVQDIIDRWWYHNSPSPYSC